MKFGGITLSGLVTALILGCGTGLFFLAGCLDNEISPPGNFQSSRETIVINIPTNTSVQPEVIKPSLTLDNAASPSPIISISPTPTSILTTNIVIDHTNWDWYNSQPSTIHTAVAHCNVFFSHASVGWNVLSGFYSLHTLNATKYPLIYLTNTGTPPNPVANGTVYHYDRGNPLWSSKINLFNSYVANGWYTPNVDIVMNKFCYIDNVVSSAVLAQWTTYRDNMLALEVAHPTTRFVYWTMPICTSASEGYAERATFNTLLRDWIATQNNKILFDIADIESWSPSGVETLYNGYQVQYAGYTSDGGHPNTTLAQNRLATGLYSLFGQEVNLK